MKRENERLGINVAVACGSHCGACDFGVDRPVVFDQVREQKVIAKLVQSEEYELTSEFTMSRYSLIIQITARPSTSAKENVLNYRRIAKSLCFNCREYRLYLKGKKAFVVNS